MGLKVDELTKIFQQYPVVLAYLFGSESRGRTTSLSDIDFAVLFGDQIAPEDYGRLQSMLLSDLMLALGRSDVDLVILNRTTPLIRFRVVSQGRLIFCVEQSIHVRFQALARRDYFDTKRIRQIQNAALARRYQLRR